MISAIHTIIYSEHAEADRVFFRDCVGLKSVDAGHGWLIFALPPAEMAFHPVERESRHEMWLMCKDITKTLAWLKQKGGKGLSKPVDRGWGIAASFKTPAGTKFLLYEPRHPTAVASTKKSRTRKLK